VERYVCGGGGVRGRVRGGSGRLLCGLHNIFGPMSDRTYSGVVAVTKVVLKHVHFEGGRRIAWSL
jgi:hypothetical protein